MSAADIAQVLSVPGKLAYNPTLLGLAGAFPHAGTELGLMTGYRVEETEAFAPTRAEEWGQVVGGVRGFTTYAIAFTLIQYDPDVLKLIYPYVTTSQNNLLDPLVLGEQQPGVVTPVSPIAFSPLDANNPGLILYAPLPWLGKGGSRALDYLVQRRLEIPVFFLGCRSAAGRTVRYGRLADLPLP